MASSPPNTDSSSTPSPTFYAPGIPSRVTPQGEIYKARFLANATSPPPVSPTAKTTQQILPPNTTPEDFAVAITELRSIVDDHVTPTDPSTLDDGWYLHRPLTHDAFSLTDDEDEDDQAFVNSAVCAPGDVAQVQGVVKWAGRWGIPVYPVSGGRNLGYGGAAARVRGSVLIDLGQRMNKVLEINEESAFCLVEPGVTYYMLYDEIQKSGKDLWIDVPDLGGGSVMGNALDRGVGYTPYGDHFGMHCGMEVVLPTGELLRTGMGALPDESTSHGSANTWQLFQYGFGPYADGLFSQSNFGIVTKMGFWLMPNPHGHQTFQITFQHESDLHAIVETIRPLRIRNIIPNVPHLRHIMQEASVYGPRSSFWPHPTPIPHDQISSLVAPKLWMGDFRWILYICVYGPEVIRDAHISVIRAEFSKIAGSKLTFPEETPQNSYLRSRVNIYTGTPDLRELDWVMWLPNGSHTAFSPISPTTGDDAVKQYEMTKRIHDKWGFDYFPTFCVGWREMHHIVMIIYDRKDADSKRRAKGMVRELIAEGAKLGMGEYRTHLAFQDQVARTYGWNEGALGRFLEGIKDTLDPEGVLAPGRNGVWGRRWRGKGFEMGGENTS